MQKDHRNHEALRQGVFLLKHNRQTDGQNNVNGCTYDAIEIFTVNSDIYL